MIYNTPPSPFTPSSTQQIQQHKQDFLWPDTTRDIVKQVLLRHYVNQNISQNDAEQILTSVSVQDLQTRQYILNHNTQTEHFAASVNKVPIAMLVLENLRSGPVNFNTVLTWQASDVRAGGGTYDQPGAPLQATLGEVLFDLLNCSGNTAARALVNSVLGGPHAVNDRLALVPQLVHTRLIPLTPTSFYMGNTTSKESLWTLEKVLSNQDTYGAFVKNALATNIYTDYGVQATPRSDFIVLANKLGQLNDPDGNNRHDVGIIYNTKTGKSYGYSLLTTSPNASTTATVRAEQFLKDVGRGVLRYAGNRAHATQDAPVQPLLLKAVPSTIEGKLVY